MCWHGLPSREERIASWLGGLLGVLSVGFLFLFLWFWWLLVERALLGSFFFFIRNYCRLESVMGGLRVWCSGFFFVRFLVAFLVLLCCKIKRLKKSP